jgi:hypothetical protein
VCGTETVGLDGALHLKIADLGTMAWLEGIWTELGTQLGETISEATGLAGITMVPHVDTVSPELIM